MKLEVKPIAKLEEGLHKGVIIAIEYRTTPQKYEYADIIIETADTKIKAGYPAALSSKSHLGMLLFRFGSELTVGAELDPDDILIGQEVTFMVKDDGEFSKVLTDTLKPRK